MRRALAAGDEGGAALEHGTRAGVSIASMQHVSFTYPNGTKAISDLSLDLLEGSVTGICGPSGCGKSSTLSVLAGIAEPTSGEIVWSPDPRAGAGPGTRHAISMVFQKDTLLPWRTVRGNVNLYAALNRRARASNDAITCELLDLVDLADAADSYPYQLSGGMRRRLAFVTAMAAQPRLLLLDEPFSALDEPTRIAIHQDVLTILRRLGTTVVLVTHDLAEATTLCDEVVILTARPGSIATRRSVPFGRDRNVLELRESKEFLDLYGQLWHDLSEQIVGARRRAGDATP